MRSGARLAAGDGFDAPEETTGHALVFVRRGAFVRYRNRIRVNRALL